MKWLVSATTDIKFHQVPDCAIRHNYLPRNKRTSISSVSWRNDGMQLVVVPRRGFTEIIDLESNVRLLKTLSQVHLPNCATFQNKSNTDIAIGTLSGEVILYDIEEDCVRHRFPTTASSIFQLKYNIEDTHLAAACSNGDVMLYGTSPSTPIVSYRIPKGTSASAVCFDGTQSNILSAGSEKGEVVVWDIANNSVLCNYSSHEALVTCVAFSSTIPDLLVSSGLDQVLVFHDIKTNKTITQMKLSNSITTFDISDIDNYIALGSQNGNILLYDSRHLKEPVSSFTDHRGKKIRQLLFQKGNGTKTQNISVDPIISTISEKSHRQYDASSDSFLVALKDFNLTRELERKAETSGLRFKFDARDISNYSNLSMSPKQNKSVGLGFSSTPISVHEHQEASPSLSSIDDHEIEPAFRGGTKEVLRNIVEEIVKEEFDNFKKICNEELKYYFQEILQEMRMEILKIRLNLLMKFKNMVNSLKC